MGAMFNMEAINISYYSALYEPFHSSTPEHPHQSQNTRINPRTPASIPEHPPSIRKRACVCVFA